MELSASHNFSHETDLKWWDIKRSTWRSLQRVWIRSWTLDLKSCSLILSPESWRNGPNLLSNPCSIASEISETLKLCEYTMLWVQRANTDPVSSRVEAVLNGENLTACARVRISKKSCQCIEIVACHLYQHRSNYLVALWGQIRPMLQIPSFPSPCNRNKNFLVDRAKPLVSLTACQLEIAMLTDGWQKNIAERSVQLQNERSKRAQTYRDNAFSHYSWDHAIVRLGRLWFFFRRISLVFFSKNFKITLALQFTVWGLE